MEFGTPKEVVFNYISTIDSAELSLLLTKQNRLRKSITTTLIVLTIVSIAYLAYFIYDYKYILDSEVVYIESTVTENK